MKSEHLDAQYALHRSHTEQEREAMQDRPMALFQALGESLLQSPGDTPTHLRTTLAQVSAHLYNGASLQQSGLPQDLEVYSQTVALHAYQVTDQDIEALHATGYSEDAIFEITLSLAYGTARNCLTQGMAALSGAKDAFKEH